MSNYANEAGEPYMTAAALRFEAELDEQSWHERQADYYMNNDEPADDDECCAVGDRDLKAGVWVCSWCGEAPEADDDFPMSMEYGEDSWLDGSYEE